MRSRPHLGLAALWLAAAAGTVPPASAQTVFDRVEVGVVELDVTVRGRDGRPVAGVDRESFTVTLDGEPLPITHFTAYTGGRRVAAATAVEAVEAPPPPAGHLAVFFDESGLDTGDRRRLLRRLGAALESDLGADTRVLVAGRLGSKLEIFQAFTREAGPLAAALETAAARVPRNDAAEGMQDFLREIERAMSLLDEAQGPSGRGPARVLAARGTVYAAELIQEVGRSTQVAERLVGLMAGLPGRKAILYLGDTLSMNPGELIDGTLRNAFSRFGIASWTEHGDATPAAAAGSAAITRLAERASSKDVLIYTLDPTGSHLPVLASAAHSSIDAGRSGGSQPTETWTPGIASRRRTELRGAFQMLAEASGGMILPGRGDDVLDRVLSDLGTYYSIGVRAPEGDERRVLPLEIRVAGKGLEVQRRRAHRARSADELDADRTVSALLAAGEEGRDGANPLAATLTAGEPEPADDGLHDLPLSIRVPVARIAVVARERAHAGQLSIFVATGDDNLRFSEVRKIVLPISIANDELMTVAGSDAEHRLDVRLPAGPARIAVGVRDDYDPELALLTLRLDVGASSRPAPSP